MYMLDLLVWLTCDLRLDATRHSLKTEGHGFISHQLLLAEPQSAGLSRNVADRKCGTPMQRRRGCQNDIIALHVSAKTTHMLNCYVSYVPSQHVTVHSDDVCEQTVIRRKTCWWRREVRPQSDATVGSFSVSRDILQPCFGRQNLVLQAKTWYFIRTLTMWLLCLNFTTSEPPGHNILLKIETHICGLQ